MNSNPIRGAWSTVLSTASVSRRVRWSEDATILRLQTKESLPVFFHPTSASWSSRLRMQAGFGSHERNKDKRYPQNCAMATSPVRDWVLQPNIPGELEGIERYPLVGTDSLPKARRSQGPTCHQRKCQAEAAWPGRAKRWPLLLHQLLERARDDLSEFEASLQS